MRKQFYIKPKYSLYTVGYKQKEFNPHPAGMYFFYCYAPYPKKEIIKICEREFKKYDKLIFTGEVEITNDHERNLPEHPSFYKQWFGRDPDNTKVDLVIV